MAYFCLRNVALISVLIITYGLSSNFGSEKYKTLAEKDNRISLKLLSPLRAEFSTKGRPMAINKKNYEYVAS